VQLVGLLLGLGGVALLVGLDFSNINLLAVAEMLLVVVCYAVGPLILARSLSDLPGLPVIAVSLAFSAIAYLPFLFFQPPTGANARTIGSVAVLSLLCTAVAFVLFFELIATIGPVRATVIAQVNPAVAVTLGVVVLGEPITAGLVIGFPMILAGSVLAARKKSAEARRPIAEAEPLAA
jgi:drug/metabolite transporter (DMT)-like permease